MYKLIKEGKAIIKVPLVKKISKEMDVFYNPVMKFNRDITILLLQQFPSMNLCDPLAGTGVRSIRFAKELKYKSITANDINEKAVNLIKKNMKLNKVKFDVFNEGANLFLLNSFGFDYIDIDPFGTPNPYLDSAVRRIARDGILAVTATDTSALAGTYLKACLRKYWAVPLRNELMHEIGLRILVRKVQLIGAQYKKALIPIFSYSKDHYMRVFLRCEKSKEETDKVLKQHGYFDNAGPIWKGQLCDKNLVGEMYKSIKKESSRSPAHPPPADLLKFLQIIEQESKIDTVGFYDLHKIAKRYKVKIPRKEELIKKLRKKGYKACETHFSGTSIKSNIELKKLLKIIQ